MPFSGATFSRTDGTRTGSTVWTQAKDSGVKIVSSGHDTHDQDIAGGLNSLLLKNGNNTPTANLPMATYKHTGVGNGSARTDYLAVGQLQDSAVNYAAATVSSTNVYVATLSPAVAAYTTGMTVRLEFAAINTASATINLNGVGAKTIKDLYGNALIGGELTAGGIMTLVYDGTDMLIAGDNPLRGCLVSVASQTVTHDTGTQCAWGSGDERFDPLGMLIDGSEKITVPTGVKGVLATIAVKVAGGSTTGLSCNIGYGAISGSVGTGSLIQRAGDSSGTATASGAIRMASASVVLPAPNIGNVSNGTYDIYGQVFITRSAGSGTEPVSWQMSVFVLR
tara:strand:+ start:919 stop:1929 length:1011 start_codon:yes stop_codon:yes gene_type:complete